MGDLNWDTEYFNYTFPHIPALNALHIMGRVGKKARFSFPEAQLRGTWHEMPGTVYKQAHSCWHWYCTREDEQRVSPGWPEGSGVTPEIIDHPSRRCLWHRTLGLFTVSLLFAASTRALKNSVKTLVSLRSRFLEIPTSTQCSGHLFHREPINTHRPINTLQL